jgi:hypothetical protein
MATGPGHGMVPLGYGEMRASTADRERAVDVLKAAFAEGRLDQTEYADRVGLVYSSRTYAELAALTADLPVGPLGTIMPVPVPQYAPTPTVAPGPPATRSTDGMAIAAFVFALGAFVTAGITAPLAMVLAVAAAVRIRRTGEHGTGLAVAAVILATFELLLVHPLFWI